MNPPRHDTPVPPTSDVVVPLRPKPPAYPAISSPTRPVIIEQDVIDYLVKAPLDQRWRILSRVAMATAHEEPAPPSAAPPPPPPPVERPSPSPSPPPSMRQPMVVVPAPTPHPAASAPPPPSQRPSQRPQLELVDQTREVLTPPPPPPSAPPPPQVIAAPPPAASSKPPPVTVAAPPPSAAYPGAPPMAPTAIVAPPRPSPMAPPRPTSAAPPPVASAAPPPAASTAPPPAASVTPPPPAPPSAPSQRLAYSAPPPPPASAADLAEELFEAMHELMQLESAQSGASFCLRLALAAVPCLAGLVHLRDPKTLELVVVGAHGPRADGLLKTRTPQVDSLVARAARAAKPVVATYGAEPDAEKETCPRHAHFDPWSVVVVPVIHGGQLLGLIEMIDPTDGNPFHEQAQAALDYIAGRLGRFLVDHPAPPMA